AIDPHAGKGSSELGLLRRLGTAFSPGDVMLADAFYCNYVLIATLIGAGVDVLFEQNGARITELSVRHPPRPARSPRLLAEAAVPTPWMTVQQYAAFADELT